MLRNTALAIVICSLLASSGFGEEPVRFESRAAQQAQEKYRRTILDARRDYLSRATALTKAYMRELETARAAAARRGKLDELALISQEQERVQTELEKLKIDVAQSEINYPAVLQIAGTGFTVAPLANGQMVFSNRQYKLVNVPSKFEGWWFTRSPGGGGPEVRIKIMRTGMVFVATAELEAWEEKGWSKLENLGFNYSSRARPRMFVVGKPMAAGQTVTIPLAGLRGAFSGTFVLAPPPRERGR